MSQYLLPVIHSEDEFKIPWQTLRSIIGGESIIDIEEIDTVSIDLAVAFLKDYGVNPETAEGQAALTEIRDLAIEYLHSVILKNIERVDFDRAISDKSLPELLLAATSGQNSNRVNWPCIVLKVAHAMAHALWHHDSEAQEQALIVVENRLRPFLFEEFAADWIGDAQCKIPLIDFEIKKSKDIFRVVTKLLQKPGNISAQIRDRIGVRFVVEDVFCSVLLIKFLRTRGIFMYANNIPEEAKNSLAEFGHMEELYKEFGPPDYAASGDNSGIVDDDKMVNPYSSADFKMIKLIERLLVLLPSGRRTFFCYELQILTRTQWEKLSNGVTHHDAYKARQVTAVRKRIMKAS